MNLKPGCRPKRGVRALCLKRGAMARVWLGQQEGRGLGGAATTRVRFVRVQCAVLWRGMRLARSPAAAAPLLQVILNQSVKAFEIWLHVCPQRCNYSSRAPSSVAHADAAFTSSCIRIFSATTHESSQQ